MNGRLSRSTGEGSNLDFVRILALDPTLSRSKPRARNLAYSPTNAKDVPPEEVGVIEEGSVLMHFAGCAELGSRPPGILTGADGGTGRRRRLNGGVTPGGQIGIGWARIRANRHPAHAHIRKVYGCLFG